MAFKRVVAGIDESQESVDAALLVSRLLPDDARLIAVGVVDTGVVAQAGFVASDALDQLETGVQERLDEVTEVLTSAERMRVSGRPIPTLLEEVKRTDATLLVVGSHGHRRGAGILMGSVMTAMLHDAPCSVFVSRAGIEPASFPRSIVVGIDGSPESHAAAETARELAERLSVPIAGITATGGKALDGEKTEERLEVEVVDASPVEALTQKAHPSDLLVVGSRGLHGLRALGSVSERVAHQAEAAVLVVRS